MLRPYLAIYVQFSRCALFTKATPTNLSILHDFNYHINERETPKTCLTNHKSSLSHHITPLVINSLGGGHTHTQAHRGQKQFQETSHVVCIAHKVAVTPCGVKHSNTLLVCYAHHFMVWLILVCYAHHITGRVEQFLHIYKSTSSLLKTYLKGP